MVSEFASGLGDRVSISGWVIPKTLKMVLYAFLFNTEHYKVQIKCKWSNPEKGAVPSPTPQYRSYWKASLQVALEYGHPTYLIGLKKLFLFNANHSLIQSYDIKYSN